MKLGRQVPLTRVALSKGGRAKSKFLTGAVFTGCAFCLWLVWRA
jgi:hypothetical protein